MTKPTVEIMITAMLSFSVVLSLIFNSTLEVRLIFGIVSLVAIICLLLAKNYNWALSILLFALILATLNLVSYNNVFKAGVAIGREDSGLRIGINILYFPFLLTLLILRRHEILDLKDRFFAVDEDEKEQTKLNRVAIFKREFENLPSEELARRLQNDDIVDDAKIAIHQILAERDMTMNNTIM